MIYDKPITICKLRDGAGVPLPNTLEDLFTVYCGEKEVFHGRFWESVQSGTRIDTLVELPLHREIDATMFAKFKKHYYSIEQAQFSEDEDGLPVTILSMKRLGVQYDAAGVRE